MRREARDIQTRGTSSRGIAGPSPRGCRCWDGSRPHPRHPAGRENAGACGCWLGEIPPASSARAAGGGRSSQSGPTRPAAGPLSSPKARRRPPGHRTPRPCASRGTILTYEFRARVRRRVRDACVDERIVPLAALAARAAVDPVDSVQWAVGSLPTACCRLLTAWTHTRQRQIEGYAECRPATDDVGLAQARKRRVDAQIVREAERQRTLHRVAELGCRVGKRVVLERADDEAIEAG